MLKNWHIWDYALIVFAGCLLVSAEAIADYATTGWGFITVWAVALAIICAFGYIVWKIDQEQAAGDQVRQRLLDLKNEQIEDGADITMYWND